MYTKIVSILMLALMVSTASAAENDVNGSIENTLPVIEGFTVSSNSSQSGSTISFDARIRDDNGAPTINNIQFTVIQESPNDDAPEEILTRVFSSWSTIAPLASLRDSSSFDFNSPSYSIPAGTYLCSLNVYDNTGANAYTDVKNFVVSPYVDYSVTPVSFPKTKVTQTVSSTFTVTNPSTSPCRVTSITFTNLRVGSQSIPDTSITADSLPTIPAGASSTITCHLTVPSGISAGTLTGTGVVNIEAA
jgi:hypothetical protein